MDIESPGRVPVSNARKALGRQPQGIRQETPIDRTRVTINRHADMVCALTVLGYEYYGVA